jgi:hypothetical protein
MNVLDPVHVLDLWEKRHRPVFFINPHLSPSPMPRKPMRFDYKLFPEDANQLARRLFGALRSLHIPSGLAGELAPLSFPKTPSGHIVDLQKEYERNLLWLHSIDPSITLPCEIGQVIDVPSHIHHIYLPWQIEVVRQLEKKHHERQMHNPRLSSDEKSQPAEAERQAKLQQMKKEFWSLMDDDAKFAYLAASQAQKQHLQAYPFLDVHLSSDLGNDHKPRSPSSSEAKLAGSPEVLKQASATENIGPQRGRRLSQPVAGRFRSHSAPASMVSDRRLRAPPAGAVPPSLLPITTSFIVSTIRSLLSQQQQKQQSQPPTASVSEPPLALARAKSAPNSDPTLDPAGDVTSIGSPPA